MKSILIFYLKNVDISMLECYSIIILILLDYYNIPAWASCIMQTNKDFEVDYLLTLGNN